MTWYELWLFLHISASIVWIGGAVLAQILGWLAQRSGDPAQGAAFGRNMAFIGPRVFLPSSIAVLVTGILLTEDGNWEWGEPFVYLGLIGWVLVAFTGLGYITRQLARAGARMATEGPSPALAAQMSRLVLVARGLVGLLFVIVFLMVTKLGT
jgi:uncharacterized membrane protein